MPPPTNQKKIIQKREKWMYELGMSTNLNRYVCHDIYGMRITDIRCSSWMTPSTLQNQMLENQLRRELNGAFIRLLPLKNKPQSLTLCPNSMNFVQLLCAISFPTNRFSWDIPKPLALAWKDAFILKSVIIPFHWARSVWIVLCCVVSYSNQCHTNQNL